MSSSVAHPQVGYELDWLALDLDGHVGMFSTAGQGPVPLAVVQHLDQVHSAIRQLTALPVVTDCAHVPAGGGTFDFWIEPCRRGLFGYDWGPVPVGPYVRLTVPSRALVVSEVAEKSVRDAAGLVSLPVRFAKSRSLSHTELGVILYTA